MSKIGDLVVRMRLQYQDYEKGLKNANSKTKTWAGNFGKIMGTMKTGVLAVATAAISIGTALIKSSDKFADAWDKTMTGAKTAWKSFYNQIISGNFKGAFSGIKEAWNSGKELSATRDEIFEFENAMAIRRAEVQNKLNDLSVRMTTGEDWKERMAAAQEYMSILKELKDEEAKFWNKQANAEISTWLRTGNIDPTSENIARVKNFFRNRATGDDELSRLYGNSSGASNGNIANAIIKATEATSELSSETLKVQKIIAKCKAEQAEENALIAEQKAKLSDLLPVLQGVTAFATTDKGTVQGFDNYISKFDELREKALETAYAIQDASYMMTDAVVNGMVNGVEELGYALAGLEGADAGSVVKALLSPLADAAISAGVLIMSTGEALTAIKAAFANWFQTGGMTAVAAGAALIAAGTAAKVGLAAIGSGKKSSGTMTSSSYSSGGGSVSNTIESSLTVYVKGTLKGSDIVISGNNTLNSWNR